MALLLGELPGCLRNISVDLLFWRVDEMNIREAEVRNMFAVNKGHYYINDKTDLVYSPDDSGWYIHDFKGDRASEFYSTRGEACEAYTSDSVEWETK